MNLPTIDLMRFDTKSLKAFIQWANEKISVAQTLITTRNEKPSKKTSNDYRKAKEERIASVMKTVLEIGDYVRVIGSTQRMPVKVVSLESNSFQINHGTYHKYGKIRSHGKTLQSMEEVQ